MESTARKADQLLPGNAMQRLQHRLLIFYWVLITAATSCSQNSDAMPPVIIEGPPTYLIYIPKKTTTLPCVATGTLPITYEWYRNGDYLEPNSKIQIGKDGNLSLNEPDEGFYQCRAENIAGLAVSNITHLQHPVFLTEKLSPPRSVTGEEFKSLVLRCSHIIQSIPEATITWHYNDDRPVKIDDRVLITDNGSLVFTSLFQSDSNRDSGSFYKCLAYNNVTKRSIGGSYFHLNVIATDARSPNGPPQLLDSSNDTIHVLEGQSANLICIFGGVNNMSGASWLLPNNKVANTLTWRLNLPNVAVSDGGNYTCSVVGGSNPIHTTAKVIKVIVDALPRLESPLQGQIVRRGSSARFTCQGLGRPTPTISWIINGTLFNSSQFFGFQNPASVDYSGNSLVLDDVQNSASVACNVSNKYGYQLSSSYLIVSDSVATTSSQSPSTFMPSSPNVISTGMMSSAAKTETLSTPSSGKSRSSSGNRDMVKTSTTISADYKGMDKGMQEDASNSPSTDSKMTMPVVIGIIIGGVILGGVFALVCVMYRRRKKKQSYSLSEQDAEIRLNTAVIRAQDMTCDSDDSGYDDITRKPNNKHIHRLSDLQEKTYL